MATSEIVDTAFGTPCPDFVLPDAAGRTYTREELARPGGLVIAVICNHCPHVKKQMAALAEDLAALEADGIGACCLTANDWSVYPADAPEHMEAFAARYGLTVPYLVDETQAVAHALGAVCTPDLFGYGPDLTLRYRGRQAELRLAMRAVAAGQDVPDQVAGMGCSIKWRA